MLSGDRFGIGPKPSGQRAVGWSCEISVRLSMQERQTNDPLVHTVLNKGSGMDAVAMRKALRLGGTTRFNVRQHLGTLRHGPSEYQSPSAASRC